MAIELTGTFAKV